MKKLIFVMIMIGVFSCIASAQPILLHQQNTRRVDDNPNNPLKYPDNHPDRLQYDNPSQWPTTDDSQAHWCAPGVNPMCKATGKFGIEDMPAHGHMNCSVPRYGELSAGQTIEISCTIKLFHVDGQAGLVHVGWVKDGNYVSHDTKWIDPNSGLPTSLQPLLYGDPNGLKAWTFTTQIEVDPTWLPMAHGWYPMVMEYKIFFTNSDSLDVHQWISIYSLAHPELPEQYSWPIMQSIGEPATFLDPTQANDRFGGQFIIFDEFMPTTMPVTKSFTVNIGSSGYGGAIPIPSELIIILDADIHNNIPGKEMLHRYSIVPDESHNMVQPFTIDPKDMCASKAPASYATGTHKYLFVTFQKDAGFSEASSLMSLTFKPNCGIIVIPPPSWHTIGVISSQDVQQFLNDDLSPVIPKQYRICQAGDVNCSSVITEP